MQANHRFNSLLWAEEDLARRTTVADAEIAANKRAIDGYNQARNDATERVDEMLLVALGLVDEASARTDAPVSRVPPGARLNSETAGSMIDRLSIMALKVHAMRAQTERGDVDEAHRAASRVKLERLQQQRADLAGCLDALLADAAAGRAYFKVYRQFKMYNDPRFNPALVPRTPGNLSGVRLLIVKTSSMGDVVHALPVVADIRRAASPAPWSTGWSRRRSRPSRNCTPACGGCADGLAQVARRSCSAAPPGARCARCATSCASSATTSCSTCRAC